MYFCYHCFLPESKQTSKTHQYDILMNSRYDTIHVRFMTCMLLHKNILSDAMIHKLLTVVWYKFCKLVNNLLSFPKVLWLRVVMGLYFDQYYISTGLNSNEIQTSVAMAVVLRYCHGRTDKDLFSALYKISEIILNYGIYLRRT